MLHVYMRDEHGLASRSSHSPSHCLPDWEPSRRPEGEQVGGDEDGWIGPLWAEEDALKGTGQPRGRRVKEIRGGIGETERTRKGNNGPLGREGLIGARPGGGTRAATPGRRALRAGSRRCSRKQQAAQGRQGVKGAGPGDSHVPGREAIGSPGVVCETPLATSGRCT